VLLKKRLSKEDLGYWLNQYAEKGDLPRLKRLLDSGADVNSRDCLTGFRPLISAAAKGRLNVVKFLLSAGAILDARVSDDYPTDHRGATALMLASFNNHKKVAELLLDAGADANASTKETGLSTPIEYAAAKGHLEIIRMLLRAGAVLTRQAITHATIYGHLLALKELLKGKQPKDIPFSPATMATNFSERTQKTRRREILEFLLNAGADINGSDAFGHTALHNAVKNSDVKLLEWLIEKRANVNRITRPRSTVLHYAAFLGECECAKVLIEAGADLTIQNAEGKTPLQWAGFHGQKEMVNLLKSVRS
jgi:uncharacterized protein